MSEDTVKVYELAKELGIDSISLLDKLKSLNINVKNHMSDLGPEEVRQARSSLGKKDESEKKSAKKPAASRVKKKAATTSEAPASKASAKAAAPAEAPVDAAAAEKKAASPIIRRRTKSDGATEVTATGVAVKSDRQETQPAHEAETHFEETEAPQQHQIEAQDQESQFQPVEETAPAAMMSEAEPTETAAPEAPEAAPPGPAPTATTTTVGGKTQITLPPRPVAPRRSILKIVEAAAPPPRPMVRPTPGTSPIKPAVKGTSTQDKDGFRIIKMTKENLDQMVEEEAAKKRGGGREAEIRPEDVRFADYRKKELVFLPKKKKIPMGKEIKKTEITEAKAQKRVIEMQDFITVQDLAAQLSVKATDVIRKLMTMGQMVTINQSLDYDTATLIAAEYKYEVRNTAFKEAEVLGSTEDKAEDLVPRPPVVTIMGHVDHGKTSLLDAIREANVAGGEAGGITQHIGAYSIEKNGKKITFIDTPGHEAFTVMRARGANVTDIVILVVAADDGVMPQTREALSHAKAAKVPIIVAVNKIDKPGANPEKVKQALAELDLLAEDWGGETMFVPVSATKKTNLDKLLDSILLQAEVLDLKANADVHASGTVLEARLEKGRGAVVSLLVARGTVKVGDAIVSGTHPGKVRAMVDHTGKTVTEASPGIAVEVLGFEGIPNAGDKFNITATETDAREVARDRTDKARAALAGSQTKTTLENLFSKVQTGEMKELSVVMKADVFGSVEAIRDSLLKLSTEKVKVRVIHAGTGGITESDVLLASASNAIIIGFNVRPETKARQLAEAEHVEIKSYTIIYELIDDIKAAMTGLLDKKKVERFLGRAEVRQTFSVPKIGTIAGSAVIDGKILRGANVRLLRESRVIYEGKMSSLRRFKDDAKEVATGYECGIGLENYNDLKPGDIIEAYQIDLVTPELNA